MPRMQGWLDILKFPKAMHCFSQLKTTIICPLFPSASASLSADARCWRSAPGLSPLPQRSRRFSYQSSQAAEMSLFAHTLARNFRLMIRLPERHPCVHVQQAHRRGRFLPVSCFPANPTPLGFSCTQETVRSGFSRKGASLTLPLLPSLLCIHQKVTAQVRPLLPSRPTHCSPHGARCLFPATRRNKQKGGKGCGDYGEEPDGNKQSFLTDHQGECSTVSTQSKLSSVAE